MSHKKKILPYAMLVIGSLTTILGMLFVAMYVLEAIVARTGEPDQSLLFWHLPILFIGLIAMLIGGGMGAWGISRVRTDTPSNNASRFPTTQLTEATRPGQAP